MNKALSTTIARKTIFILLILLSTLSAEEVQLIGEYGKNLKPFPMAIGATSDSNARNVSVDGKGIVYCVWHDDRLGVGIAETKEIYLRCLVGNKWAEEVRITNDKVQSTCPSIMSHGEYTYLVYSNNVFVRKAAKIYRGDIFLVKMHSGKILGKPIRISQSNCAGDPSLYIDVNNKVHIVWSDFQNGRCLIYYRCMNVEGKLEAPERISLDSDSITEGNIMRGNNVQPSVAVERNGSIHIVWLNQPQNENASGFRALCHKIKSISGWGKIGTITHDNSFLSIPSCYIDVNDNIHISFAKGMNTRLYYSKYAARNWMKPQVVYDVPERFATNSSIISDSKSNVHIVWDEAKSPTDVDIFYGKKVSGTFSKIRRITMDNKYSGCPTISIDEKDRVHVLWHDNHEGPYKIYYFMIEPDTTNKDAEYSEGVLEDYQLVDPNELTFELKGYYSRSYVDEDGVSKTVGGSVDQLICEGKMIELMNKRFDGEFLETKQYGKIKIQFSSSLTSSGFSVWLTANQKEMFIKAFKPSMRKKYQAGNEDKNQQTQVGLNREAAVSEILPDSDRRVLAVETEEFKAAHGARPDDYVSHYNLGNFHMDRREYDQAISAFEQSIKLRPNYLPPYVNASLAYNAAGQNEKAEASLKQALAIDPNCVAAHLNLGLLLVEQKRMDGAEAAFRKTLSIDPNSAVAAYNLGVMLAEDDMSEALKWCRKAVTLQPDNYRYAYTYAFYLRQSGSVEQAIEALKSITDKQMPYADAYFLLGYIYENQQKYSEAREVYSVGLALPGLNEQQQHGFAARLRQIEGR